LLVNAPLEQPALHSWWWEERPPPSLPKGGQVLEVLPCNHADSTFQGFDVKVKITPRAKWDLTLPGEDHQVEPFGAELLCGWRGEPVTVVELTRPPGERIDGDVPSKRGYDERRLTCTLAGEPFFTAMGSVRDHRRVFESRAHAHGREVVTRALDRWGAWVGEPLDAADRSAILKWRTIKGVPHRLRQMLAKMLIRKLVWGTQQDHELHGVECEVCHTRGWEPHRLFECPASVHVWHGARDRLHSANIETDIGDKRVLLGIVKPANVPWRPWRQIWASIVWASWKKWVQIRLLPLPPAPGTIQDTNIHEVVHIWRQSAHACIWRLQQSKNDEERLHVEQELNGVWTKLNIVHQVQRKGVPCWEVIQP